MSKHRFLAVRVSKSAEPIFGLFLLLLDMFIINAVFMIVFKLWFGQLQNNELYINAYLRVRPYWFLIYVLYGFWLDIFNLRGIQSPSDSISRVGASLLLTFITFNILTFLLRDFAALAYNLPRPVVLMATAASIAAAALIRGVLTAFFCPYRQIRRAIIVGSPTEGKRMIRHFHRRGGVRFRIVQTLSAEQIDSLASEVIFKHAHEVFITEPQINLNRFWASIFYERKEAPHSFMVRISADAKKTITSMELKRLDDLPLTTICSRPLSNAQYRLKRIFDICFACFALVAASPVMALAAIVLRLDSKGPVFFKQKRVGEFGKDFNVIKFRTMKVGAEAKSGPQISTDKDPRVSPVGRFIRHFGIDELPQFFLVLTGEMSVVGPRPERPFFADKYPEFQGRRLALKPGVTGLAAVNSRYYLKLTDKVVYDYYYIDNYSLLLDLKIIFQTVWVLLFERKKQSQAEAENNDK